MFPKSFQAEPFCRDERGLGLVDSPFMIFLATILIAFVAVLGIYLASTLAATQKNTEAVDGAEKIYNAADLLSAGAPDSTRTIWIKVPDGYLISFDGNITLKGDNGVVGVPLHLNGVGINGMDLPGGKRFHLLMEYKTEDSEASITVTQI